MLGSKFHDVLRRGIYATAAHAVRTSESASRLGLSPLGCQLQGDSDKLLYMSRAKINRTVHNKSLEGNKHVCFVIVLLPGFLGPFPRNGYYNLVHCSTTAVQEACKLTQGLLTSSNRAGSKFSSLQSFRASAARHDSFQNRNKFLNAICFHPDSST